MTPPGRGPAPASIVRLAFVVVAAAMVIVVAASPTKAADDPREVQGRALFAKGEYEGALEIYAQLFAEKVDPVYLRNIGRCNQKLRRPAKAIDAFREYLRRVRRIKPEERQEIEGFIHEMEDLQADMDRQAQKERAAARAEEAQQQAKRDAEKPPVAAAAPPLAAAPPRERAAPPSPADRDGGDRDIDRPVTPAPRASGGQTGQIFVAVLAGSGFGIATGTGELNPQHKVASTGFAPAQLGHLAPEVGIFPLPRLLLSVQLRLQYVVNVTGQHLPDAGCGGDGYCVPEKLALAAFGRIGWLVGERGFRGFIALAAGGGNIRHVAAFANDKTCGTASRTSCVDSLASGPFLIGPSFGLFWELGSVFDLVAEVNSVVGYPKFTVNFDFDLGLAVRL